MRCRSSTGLVPMNCSNMPGQAYPRIPAYEALRLSRFSPRKIRFPEARAARLFRVPRPRHQARDRRQGGGPRDPRPPRQGAARRVALARLQAAVRLRAEGLGAVRVRRPRPDHDESRQLLLPAAAHPPPRAPALEEPRDDRDRRPCRLQDFFGEETCSQKVTGPSLPRLTFIPAPKRPACTFRSSTFPFSPTSQNNFSPTSGEAPLEKLGRGPLFVSATRVNCGTARRWPWVSRKDKFIFPAASAKIL